MPSSLASAPGISAHAEPRRQPRRRSTLSPGCGAAMRDRISGDRTPLPCRCSCKSSGHLRRRPRGTASNARRADASARRRCIFLADGRRPRMDSVEARAEMAERAPGCRATWSVAIERLEQPQQRGSPPQSRIIERGRRTPWTAIDGWRARFGRSGIVAADQGHLRLGRERTPADGTGKRRSSWLPASRITAPASWRAGIKNS